MPIRVPDRPPDGHKGTFGTVAVIGGCARDASRMIGAPALAALGALRSGAGLARILAPDPILDAILTICPSATGIALPIGDDKGAIPHLASAAIDRLEADAFVVGPGLGRGPEARTITLLCAQRESPPIVFDADALHALAAIPELWRDFHAAAILTPHPGEFRALAASLAIHADPLRDETRPAAAALLAQRLGCITILKGARTIVSDGQNTETCPFTDPALATAGTGDVLAGLIAGLIAQSRAAISPFDCALTAVHIHAHAAAAWRQSRCADAGLLAAELADHIPSAIATLRSA